MTLIAHVILAILGTLDAWADVSDAQAAQYYHIELVKMLLSVHIATLVYIVVFTLVHIVVHYVTLLFQIVILLCNMLSVLTSK